MPASDEHYRSQRSLNVWFAIGSILLSASLVWMILADHLRPWKDVQREFFKIEQAKLTATEKQKVEEEQQKNGAAIEQVEAEIKAAQELAKKNRSKIKAQQGKLDQIIGRYTELDTLQKFQKAELDSLRSFYDEMIDQHEDAKAREFLAAKIIPAENKLKDLTKQKQTVVAERQTAEKAMAELKGNISDLEKKRDALLRDSSRIANTLKQKEQNANGLLAWLRGLPVIDLAAPPEKIRQISLPDLTINYNFKEVPRYDRCMTCHLAIDRTNYDVDANHQKMPTVFASHPHVADGVEVFDKLTGKTTKAGLYLDSNGPHPINYFGCTICHGGQGSGTDFTFSSHEPNTLEQKEEWRKEHNWEKIHYWDYPMLPKRFIESSCLKCHTEVTDIPQAEKLQAGYQRITKFGCTGCHLIGGSAMGPNLTDTPKVGPNLEHVGSKSSKDWTLKWVKHPQAFRPDTRMPQFYGVTNNSGPHDLPLSHAEIQSIVHYLYAKSTAPKGFVEPPAKSDPEKGKTAFLQKGCMACHAHKEFSPEKLPASAAPFASADHGPNLSNVADKFKTHAQGYYWLTNWIFNPEAYHPGTLMPNLQLAVGDAADIASWLLSVKAEWAEKVDVPSPQDPDVAAALDKLVMLYKGKSGVPLSELDAVADGMSVDDKLMYLGEKTISRMGCFGCHNIPGFENAKPIGTPLDGWGSKSPAKLDYAHIMEYLEDQPIGEGKTRDGTDLYYQEELEHQSRMGFLYQKLHRPRSYDYKKTKEDLKSWDERLRMPQFSWANDPKAIEEVMTFVLGLTGERIGGRYVPRPDEAGLALAKGSRLLTRYNCKGCHVLEMPSFTIAAGVPVKEAMPQFDNNVDVSYNGGGLSRNKDFLSLYPGLTFDPTNKPKLTDDDAKSPIVLSGMPTQSFENEVTIQLWEPVTVRGYTFNVGDQVVVDSTKVMKTPASGGNFGWLQAYIQAEKGGEFGAAWNKLPPPLVREGWKVQTPWLTSFLKDPYLIRPAAMLRMPRFHYASAADETKNLANYFAARDHADFPYQDIPERKQAYIATKQNEHPNYFSGGWSLITKGACVQCHAIGTYKPNAAGGVVNGPDLRQVGTRFRSEYLTKWLGNPMRLVPYTAMPQNIQPHGPPAPGAPKSLEGKPLEQVEAIRDTLFNFADAVEQQLASGSAAEKAPAAAVKPTGGGGR